MRGAISSSVLSQSAINLFAACVLADTADFPNLSIDSGLSSLAWLSPCECVLNFRCNVRARSRSAELAQNEQLRRSLTHCMTSQRHFLAILFVFSLVSFPLQVKRDRL